VILALESSGPEGSLAFVEGGEVVHEIRFDCPRGRGGELFGALEEMLSGKPLLWGVAVGIGPGSYNGIRAAIAAAWGVATARNIPLVGLSSLLGLDEGEYCAVGDARRGQYYFARIANGHFTHEPCLVEADELVSAVSSTARVYAPSPIDLLPQAEIRHSSASRLGRLAALLQPQATIPEPLYLKPAHITTPTKTQASV